jgi:hypothetical protein
MTTVTPIKPSERRPEWYTVFAVYYSLYAGPRGGAERGPQSGPDCDITPIWDTPEVAAAKAAIIADQAQRGLAAVDYDVFGSTLSRAERRLRIIGGLTPNPPKPARKR